MFSVIVWNPWSVHFFYLPWVIHVTPDISQNSLKCKSLLDLSRTNGSRCLVHRLIHRNKNLKAMIYPSPLSIDTNTSLRFKIHVYHIPEQLKIKRIYIGQNKISCDKSNQESGTHLLVKYQCCASREVKEVRTTVGFWHWFTGK